MAGISSPCLASRGQGWEDGCKLQSVSKGDTKGRQGHRAGRRTEKGFTAWLEVASPKVAPGAGMKKHQSSGSQVMGAQLSCSVPDLGT